MGGHRGWLTDLGVATRGIIARPNFAIPIILTLAVASALALLAVAVVEGVMFRPLPGVGAQSELVEIVVRQECRGCGGFSTSLIDLETVRDGLAECAEVAATAGASVAVDVTGADSKAVRAAFVTANYFHVLRSPLEEGIPMGRTGDDSTVLSHRLVQRSYGASARVVGERVRVGNLPVTVTGVAASAFGGIDVSLMNSGPDLWLPVAMIGRIGDARPGWVAPNRDGEYDFRYVARPESGFAKSDISNRLSSMAARIAERKDKGTSVWIELKPLTMHDMKQVGPLITVVLIVPLLVLIIAWMNVASLIVARAAGRWREVAIRVALGASRGRIVRLFALECVCLCIVALLLALPVVQWGLLRITELISVPVPLGYGAFAFVLACSIAGSLLVSLIPNLRRLTVPTGSDLGASQGMRGSFRESGLRRWLVCGQVALSLALMAAGVQLTSAFDSVQRSGGTRPDHLLMAHFDLRQTGAAHRADEFYRQLSAAVSRHPQAVAAGFAPPRAFWTFGRGHQLDNSVAVWLPGDAAKDPRIILGGWTGGDALRAAGLRLLDGRSFTNEETATGLPRVAIVSQSFVEQLVPSGAIGQTVRVAARRQGFAKGRDLQIVGVVAPAVEPTFTVARQPVPAIYLPGPLEPSPSMTVYVKTADSAAGMKQSLAALARSVDPTVPVLELETLEEKNERVMPEVALARLASYVGTGGLLLAAWGLYALMSYAVAVRSNELGLRVALGAGRQTIVMLIVKEAALLVLIGGVLGMIGSDISVRIVRAEIHAVPVGTGWVALYCVGLLAIVALVGALKPALAAASTDPIVAMRNL
jgi:predicted permease